MNIRLDDIEKRVSEIFAAQKDEVEQSLAERINREKEEAQKRIDAVNQEFTQVRTFLDEHKKAMAELQSTEEHLRGEIRGHFERAVNYQKMMENAAVLAGGELEKIGELNQELEQVRAKAESEYAGLKDKLSGYAGIMAQIPVPSFGPESDVDWTEEVDKLRRVRDLLGTLRQAVPAEDGNGRADGASDDPETSARAAETAEELAASLGLIGPDEDGLSDDIDFAAEGSDQALPDATTETGTAETAPAEAETAPIDEPVADAQGMAFAMAADAPGSEPSGEPAPTEAAAPDAAAPAPSPSSSPAPSPVLDGLARFRRTEPVNNGIELAFFGADAESAPSFLDAEAFMAAVGKIVGGAEDLHAQLTQTTSVKDLFLLKQEILNQQEVLRKVFFRVVRFCDKEDGRLPEPLGEVVSAQGMKDIIERLTMANWSDPSDFKPFLSELKAMKRAFETRKAGSPSYLQTVLDELEGREN
ncbi:MAG: hypothetical protein JW775_09690 [Candidatus Aminicenantes bacterium]|nr:hypothetical protein [Candidatus Aminicenantes bacterium]